MPKLSKSQLNQGPILIGLMICTIAAFFYFMLSERASSFWCSKTSRLLVSIILAVCPYFIDKALNNVTIRRSFEVQKHLLSIIVENKELIEPTLFHSALSEFPHKSGGLGWVDSGKL